MDSTARINGKIYIIANKINSMKYVGSTLRSVEVRMRCHKNDMARLRHLPLYRDMIEYGFDRF